MTDLEAGGAAKPKRASKPRQKKAVSGSTVTPTTGDAAANRAVPSNTPRAAASRSAPPQGASSRPPTSKSSSPRAAARPVKFRAAGPGLNDWLSFALLLLLIVGAVLLYQWRGEAAKLPASQTTTQQAAPPRR